MVKVSLRQRREFKRPEQKRDASLIVIASEGQKTEPKYFNDLISNEYYPNSRIHIVVLERTETASSPSHVIKLLDKFKKEYRLNKNDQLWMLIDRDAQSWTQQTINEIARLCTQKNYFLALSNPNFEIWLLLHITDINNYSISQKNELFENLRVSRSRKRLDAEILNILGSYNKSNIDTSKFLPFVKKAIVQSRLLDVNATDRWPNYLGTRVYILVENIIN